MQKDSPMTRFIEFTLVNLSSTVDKDLNGQHFPLLVTNALDSCATAQTMLQPKKTSYWPSSSRSGSKHQDSDQNVRDRLVKDVMKYVKVQDKYTAVVSLLLKSQAFYKTFPLLREESSPLVDLPRTTKGKPFIPTTGSAVEAESNCYPVSVSHQYPFCGVARLVTTDTKNTVLHLGLDIVVFEPLRTDLYPSVEDYLQVFQGSFTSWEWERMHSSQCSDKRLLNEFHLRWSMKEAYTKALGLGMYLDFCKFETRLDAVDNCAEDNDASGSLWSTVLEKKEGMHLRGCVRMGVQEVNWDFYFLPFFDLETDQCATGCACICFGPLENDHSSHVKFKEQVSWTTLQELTAWHSKR